MWDIDGLNPMIEENAMSVGTLSEMNFAPQTGSELHPLTVNQYQRMTRRGS